jgi:hypothetical protein
VCQLVSIDGKLRSRIASSEDEAGRRDSKISRASEPGSVYLILCVLFVMGRRCKLGYPFVMWSDVATCQVRKRILPAGLNTLACWPRLFQTKTEESLGKFTMTPLRTKEKNLTFLLKILGNIPLKLWSKTNMRSHLSYRDIFAT